MDQNGKQQTEDTEFIDQLIKEMEAKVDVEQVDMEYLSDESELEGTDEFVYGDSDDDDEEEYIDHEGWLEEEKDF